MGQADAKWRQADPLHAVRNILRDLGRKGQKGAQRDKSADADRNPGQAGEQDDALDIPGVAPDLLFERGQCDSLLYRGQALAMNQDPALVPQPLKKTNTCDAATTMTAFSISYAPFSRLILAGRPRGCTLRPQLFATAAGVREYKSLDER